MSDKPTTVAVATYHDRDVALLDYEAVRAVKHHGGIDHLAIAVVEKDATGELKIDRHDTSAKHLAWGGVILGAALTVVAPPIGITTLAGATTSAAVLGGAGGIIGHFHRNIPKATVREMDALLLSGTAGLVIVAVNPNSTDIGALLPHAEKKIVTNAVYKDDTDDALQKAFDAAEG